jgi:hypothetical protein
MSSLGADFRQLGPRFLALIKKQTRDFRDGEGTERTRGGARFVVEQDQTAFASSASAQCFALTFAKGGA